MAIKCMHFCYILHCHIVVVKGGLRTAGTPVQDEYGVTWWLGQDVVVTTQPYSWADQDRLGAHPPPQSSQSVCIACPCFMVTTHSITSMALASSPCLGFPTAP